MRSILLHAAMPLLLLSASVSTVAAQTPAEATGTLEPEASDALNRMGVALRALKRFEVRSDVTTEQVFPNGQKLQLQRVVTYLVEHPDRLRMTFETAGGVRRVFYDGRELALVGDTSKRYLRYAVNGSIAQVLDAAYERYGIDFPLQDLFRWGSPTSTVAPPTEGFKVGTAIIDGRTLDHYAFRQEGVDFQIWLDGGAQPLPRKLVITDVETPGMPQYSALFSWNLKPAIPREAFVFRPGKDYQVFEVAADTQAGR